MFIRIAPLLFVLFSSAAIGQTVPKPPTIIAFGSCDDEDEPQDMWKEIVAQKPNLWIWGGDNVYADTHDMALLKTKYDKQKSNPDYQRLLHTCPVTGTWDDHDYGVNDGGKLYNKKNDSKKQLLDFLGMAEPNSVYEHEGVYNSLTIGKNKQKIKIINLDTRSFRDTVYKISYVDTLTQKKLTRFQANPTGDVLGEAQWQWLAEELTDAAPQLFIINSSIQVLSEEHRFEKWGNLPTARQRFLDLLTTANKKVIIISGDRHIGEFSKIHLIGLSYPLYDFTSSGLTHTWSERWEESNKYRAGDLVIEKTFGLIKVDWSMKEPKVLLQIRGLAKLPYGEQVIDFNKKN